MSAQDERHAGAGVSALLTVEEAARVLRIGRTLAYQLARRYRATDGAEGLPVIELGNVLRVPRAKLEALVGGPVDDPPPPVVQLDARRVPPAAPSTRRSRSTTRNAQTALPFTAPDAT
jgi:hypothetical protein